MRNKLRINSQLFEIFRSFPFSIQAGVKLSDNHTHIIEKDIPRTFPDLNEFFAQIESIGDSLREVLTAFKSMRPDIGYCQGMSHVVGMLLLHCGPPQECFKVFCNMHTSALINDFHSFNFNRINGAYKVFWRLLSECCPKLHSRLVEEDMFSCSIFFLEWIITQFSTLEIDVAAYIWDQIFLFGDLHMMRVSIAICKIIESKILAQSPELDVQKELKQCAKHVQRSDLAKVLRKVKTQIKYEYMEQLFEHINDRLDKIDKCELMELPEHQWIK